MYALQMVRLRPARYRAEAKLWGDPLGLSTLESKFVKLPVLGGSDSVRLCGADSQITNKSADLQSGLLWFRLEYKIKSIPRISAVF
jgi:hypothetical protein